MYFYIHVTTQGGFMGTVMVLFNKILGFWEKSKRSVLYSYGSLHVGKRKQSEGTSSEKRALFYQYLALRVHIA
jgi:hypothetical protein